MPSKRINIDPYLPQIRSWLEEKVSVEQIRLRLIEQHGLKLSRSTFTNRLRDAGIRSLFPCDRSDALRARITTLFRTLNPPDTVMLAILRGEGFTIKDGHLSRFRRELGLRKVYHGKQKEDMERRTREILLEELSSGKMVGMTRGQIYTYIHSKYNITGRDRIYEIVKEIDPDVVNRPLIGIPILRREQNAPGPNYMWEFDEFLAFESFGFHIYAAIDVYSRYILWYYVGLSRHRQVCVTAQHLATLVMKKTMPRYLMVHTGPTTIFAADVHHQLSSHLRPVESGSPVEPSDCLQPRRGDAKSRIEIWWDQFTMGGSSRWKQYFGKLKDEGEYNEAIISDRIAFIAVYMPLMRQEIRDLVHRWNHHKIARRRGRPDMVPGVPTVLYSYPELSNREQFVIDVPKEHVEPFAAWFADFRLEQYLPQPTSQWCKDVLLSRGFDDEFPMMKRVNPSSETRMHTTAFKQLRDAIRVHMATQQEPILQELPEPDQNSLWTTSEEIQRFFTSRDVDPRVSEIDMDSQVS